MRDEVLAHLRKLVAEPDLSGTRYELRGLLGKGGMGEVWRVWDTQLEREAALKVMEDAAGMLTEARTVAKLEHPGIVAMYEAGTLLDGRGYGVMRIVEGERLDIYLKGAHGLAERLEVAMKLCDAVAYAHSQGVIHRDLNPRNVLLGKFGQVVVLDWGLALWERHGDGTGEVVGTRRYMAPEQQQGQSVDARIDVFALGVLIEDLLPVGAGKPLLAIAKKAQAANPGDRYSSVEELAADLRRYQNHLPVTAHRENGFERAARFARRNRVLLVLLASYIVVRVLLYLWRVKS